MFEYLSWLHHLHNMNVHKDPPKMYNGHSTVLVFLLLQHIQKLNKHIAFAYILRNQQANNIIFFSAYSCRCWVVLNDNVIECKHKQIIASFSYSTIAHQRFRKICPAPRNSYMLYDKLSTDLILSKITRAFPLTSN